MIPPRYNRREDRSVDPSASAYINLTLRRKIELPQRHAALFLMAPMTAVSMAPPAPPAIAYETIPPTLRLPDCAAATIDGSNNVTIWPSTPPPTRPETMLPIMPRSKVGDDFPAPTPPSAPAIRLIKICSMLLSRVAIGSNLRRPELGVELPRCSRLRRCRFIPEKNPGTCRGFRRFMT